MGRLPPEGANVAYASSSRRRQVGFFPIHSSPGPCGSTSVSTTRRRDQAAVAVPSQRWTFKIEVKEKKRWQR